MSSLRESILSRVGSLKEEPAQMPGADGPVDIVVRELTGREARMFETMAARAEGSPIGYLLQQSIVDPVTKELVFEAGDRDALEGLGVTSLQPVLKIAQALNIISDEDIKKAKETLTPAPAIG